MADMTLSRDMSSNEHEMNSTKKRKVKGNKVRKNLMTQQYYSVLQSQFILYTIKIPYRSSKIC